MLQEESKIQETSKRHIIISDFFHKKLKKRSVENHSTIEKEIDKILKKEFDKKRK